MLLLGFCAQGLQVSLALVVPDINPTIFWKPTGDKPMPRSRYASHKPWSAVAAKVAQVRALHSEFGSGVSDEPNGKALPHYQRASTPSPDPAPPAKLQHAESSNTLIGSV